MTKTVYVFDDDGYELEITGEYTPAQKGCNYLKNGDPGYPDEPATFEIDEVKREGIKTNEYNIDPPDGRDALSYLEDICIEKCAAEDMRGGWEDEE